MPTLLSASDYKPPAMPADARQGPSGANISPMINERRTTMRNQMIVMAAAIAGAFVLSGCEVEKKQEGDITLPSYEVTKTRDGNVTVPEYEVTTPEVSVETKTVEMKVPDIDIRTPSEQRAGEAE
jgi:hypothetical protein